MRIQTNIVWDDINNQKRTSLLSMNFSIPEYKDDVYVVPNKRLDIYATEFYGDPKLWWIIAKANNLKHAHNIPNLIIRIPRNLTLVMSDIRKAIKNEI